MRFKSPEYDAFLREVEARHSCSVRVQSDSTLPHGLGAFKIYIDGNVRITPQRLRQTSTEELEVIPLVPGRHRVVVREANVHKEDRAESNTLFLELTEGQEVTLVVQCQSGVLALLQAGA